MTAGIVAGWLRQIGPMFYTPNFGAAFGGAQLRFLIDTAYAREGDVSAWADFAGLSAPEKADLAADYADWQARVAGGPGLLLGAP